MLKNGRISATIVVKLLMTFSPAILLPSSVLLDSNFETDHDVSQSSTNYAAMDGKPEKNERYVLLSPSHNSQFPTMLVIILCLVETLPF